MTTEFEIYSASRGKKATDEIALMVAKLMRERIVTNLVVEARNYVLVVWAAKRGKSAAEVGQLIADAIGTKETFAEVEPGRMRVTA